MFRGIIMKSKLYLILGSLGIVLLGSCNDDDDSKDQIVSQRFVHKYGYAVAKEEWSAQKYPGQVITTLKNGVTITSSFENGKLHGPYTRTWPHSQTLQTYTLYSDGEPVKEVRYDNKGMPLSEIVQLSPTRQTQTLWYNDGTPLSIEEYANEELLEGQYFSMNNELEARVEKGVGKRIKRDANGYLLSQEDIKAGSVIKEETFYGNGMPESICQYKDGKLQGERKIFAENGEPLAIEHYSEGLLNGNVLVFLNGAKSRFIPFVQGYKQGKEIHYRDGNSISQEILWDKDRRHGPTIYFIDGIAHTQWYFEGDKVTHSKYEELCKRDEAVVKQLPPPAIENYR